MASDSYDAAPLRFFDINAEALVREAAIPAGATVLDVATGTGKVALEAARAVGPRGRVVGVDVSGGMLDRAREQAGELPVEFHEMDARELQFDDTSFDVVLCGCAITFLHPHIVAAMRQMYRVARPGGTVAVSTFAESAFMPIKRIVEAWFEDGSASVRGRRREAWTLVDEPRHMERLFKEGRLGRARVALESTGYRLRTADDWWRILWGSGWRGPISRLDEEQREQLRHHVLEEVDRLGEEGLWLDASALIGLATRRAGRWSRGRRRR